MFEKRRKRTTSKTTHFMFLKVLLESGYVNQKKAIENMLI